MYTKWIHHGESEEILPYTVNDVPKSADEIYAILDDVVDQVQNDDPEEIRKTMESLNG